MGTYNDMDSSRRKEAQDYVSENINDVTVESIAERYSLTLSSASYLLKKVRNEKKSSFDFSR